MRCMQHVLWRGALALGLLVSGGTGAMLMPQAQAPVCESEPQRDVLIVEIDAALASSVHVVRPEPAAGQQAPVHADS